MSTDSSNSENQSNNSNGSTTTSSEAAEKKNVKVSASTTKTTIPSWRDAAAGASAGAFSKTITAPIERIKLVLQLQHSLDHHGSQPALHVEGRPPMNAWQLTKSIYHNEGLFSFWRGNLPSIMRVSGTAAINFTMMNYYKEAAVRPFMSSQYNPNIFSNTSTQSSTLSPEQLERRRKNLASLVAGGMAGGTATTLLYPIEFLRTRLAADLVRAKTTGGRYKFKGMGHALTTILKSDGARGLFQGYGVALFGGIFYRILFLGGYDVLKSETERSNQQQQQQQIGGKDPAAEAGLSWGQRIVIAQTVSLTAGTMSYPLDSVRRRLMMQAGKPQEGRLYKNSFHCIRLVLQKEGVRGFFLGIGPNILRSVSGALLLVAYDLFKEVIT